WPPPFGSAACTALPEFACTCARARIQVFGGSLKRWQELLTFCQRYAGCCSKVAWSVFQLVIAQHHTEYTLFPIRSSVEETRVCAGYEPRNGEEIPRASARFYALQTAIN